MQHKHTPHRPLPLPLPLALAGSLVFAAGAWAQTPPNAGQLLEEARRPPPPALPTQTPPRLIDAPLRPTINMPEGVSVTVAGFRISGASSFALGTLEELVKPWVGKKLDIRGLNEAAGALTRFYQSSGHLLSYAYLPAQRVADGVIELAVLEGKLEGVQIVTAQEVRLRDEVIQAHTDSLTAPGPLLQEQVERKLLLLGDIPGVVARAAFTPGANKGGAEMVVSVAEDEPLDIRAEVNNHGGIATGHYRAGLTVHMRDLFGWGDSTYARGLVSSRGALVSGSINSSVPLGGDGWRAAANLSRLSYQLAGGFASTGASGHANTVGLDVSYALRRSADSNLSLKAGVDHKQLRDELVQLGTANAKRIDTGDLSASFDARDSIGGLTAGSATATLGQLRAGEEPRREWHRLAAQLVRQQALVGRFSLYGRVAVQTTGTTLDSSEKMGLAGAGAVRAYAPGEASVDHGGLATLELRYGLDFLGGSLVTSLFHDYAGGQINRGAFTSAGNEVELNGTGLGLSWSSGGIGLNASLAWRGKRTPTTDANDPSPRLYFQLTYTP